LSSPGEPNTIDYLTLTAAVIAPIATSALTVWTIRRAEKERFDLHIDWAWEPHADVTEFPVLHIHNKSTSMLVVTEIGFLRGAIWRKLASGTAVYWEYPSDLPFPVMIDARQTRSFRLYDDRAFQLFGRLSAACKWLGQIHRSALWVDVRTAEGSVKRLGAEEALPRRERPRWKKVEEEGESV
jgi:hypothetical protein